MAQWMRKLMVFSFGGGLEIVAVSKIKLIVK